MSPKKAQLKTCEDCGGRGLLDSLTLCDTCEGSGKVKSKKKGAK